MVSSLSGQRQIKCQPYPVHDFKPINLYPGKTYLNNQPYPEHDFKPINLTLT